MQSLTDDLAAAVVDELNAAAFSQGFEATHVEFPEWELTELASLVVAVFDSEINTENHSRGKLAHTIEIDVAITRHVANDAAAPRDLKALSQEVFNHFAGRKFTASLPAMQWQRIAWLAHKVPEHLRDKRVFMAVIRLTYWRLQDLTT